MIEKLLPLAEYLKEKTLFPSVKRVLNFCFVLGISSFLFEKYYFKYSLLDITDYKRQYEFIAHGIFIIPFSIFFLVWALTGLLGNGLFTIFNYGITEKYRKKILEFSFHKSKTGKQLKRVDAMIQENMIVKPKKDWYITIYNSLKSSFTPKEYRRMINDLEQFKQKSISDSILVLRAMVAIFIYFLTITYFGWLLLTLLLITLFSCIILLVLAYQ